MYKDLQVAGLVFCILFQTFLGIFLPEKYLNYSKYFLVKICRDYIVNLKLVIHGDLSVINKNTIIMSNHYEGLDFITLMSLFTDSNKNIYTIAKSDMINNGNYFINTLIHYFYKSFNFISYTRGCKESGEIVKNKVREILKYKKNTNILVFPEGRSRRAGQCLEFKPGIFKVAQENNVNILPITLKYTTFDGKNKGEKCILKDWLNHKCHIYIHELVKVDDSEKMLKETFDKISSKT
jgi:1-acyl-sn-glycerol-3-phosphate acyltransferase